MQIIRKRFLPLVWSLTMVFACSATAFATEPITQVVGNTSDSDAEIMTLASDYILWMHVSQKTSTSKESGSFTIVSGVKKAALSVDIRVNAPCTMYFFISDVNGKSLGSSSITITRAGSFSMTPTPSSLGSGNYQYSFMFDKSGINYSLYFRGTL